MSDLAAQLELLGLDETRRRVVQGCSPAERRKMLKRVETMHEVMSALPASDELSFLHSGLCQTCLPHNRPEQTR